jgi:alpha-galactosidase
MMMRCILSLADTPRPIEYLAAAEALCHARRVNNRIEFRARDIAGAPIVESLDYDSTATTIRRKSGKLAIELSFAREHGGEMLRAAVANLSGDPIQLESCVISVPTGIARASRAQMLKHGYQSWSETVAVAIDVGGAAVHRRDSAHRIIRLSHQSEARRPPEFPEYATSEMFTIVESESADFRVLVGYTGTAHQLTTITASTPDIIKARALFDNVTIAPGEKREVEPLFVMRSKEAAAAIAARWASIAGHAMNARISAPFQRGWCSWYHYFHAVTEDAVRANLRALAAMRSEFPVDVFQIDDGFQSALGDWDTTNAKFPSGLKRLAGEIREAGFAAGIWTAPFLAARDSRLMREHPDWFITHGANGPLRAGYNTNWTTDPEGFAYALDPSNPALCDHLVRLFERMVREFGYSYLKLDFLFAGAAEGIRFDNSITRAEAIRRGLSAIRTGAGDDTFILGCGCPLGPAVGIVDGMRIGPDVAPAWGESAKTSGDPSTVHALDAIIARSFMHRRFWLNDPDCLMLRTTATKLTANERHALAATIAASGGMLIISDDMALLGAEESTLYRAAAGLGRSVDANAVTNPVLAIDLMARGNVRGLIQSDKESSFAMILNRAEAPAEFELSRIPGATRNRSVLNFDGNSSPAPAIIKIPPHSATIVRSTG